MRTRFIFCWAIQIFACLAFDATLGATEGSWEASDPRDVQILEKLEAGHWVEVRGSLVDNRVFAAERIELTRPKREDSLWGPAERGARPGSLSVLGREIETGSSTHWRGGTLESSIGQRVRVRGLRDKSGHILARSIEIRDPGVARIAGRIERSERFADGGGRLEVLGFSILVPSNIKQRSAVPLSSLSLAEAPRPHSSVAADHDDFFGEGWVVSERARVGLRHEVTFNSRRNLELDGRDDIDIDERDDRDDAGTTLRARLVWAPRPRLGSLVDLRHRVQRRELGGAFHDTESRVWLGEAYLLFREIGFGFDLQLGRQDFDDSREWLYDQNLDGLRLFRDAGRLHFELSMSTTLSDGSSRDQEATNTIFYVSNRGRRRHLAAYVVHRDFGARRDETQSHLGARAIGRVTDNLRGWAELSALTGNRGQRDVAAWGGDLGLSWASSAPSRLTLTAGVAHGSGDDGGSRDRRFRQTGLQDNNARLGGVTAVRYYGELMAPELSNMTISTIGISRRVSKGISVELIGHSYRQDIASPRLTRTNFDQRPDGIHPNLGTEIDLVVGVRRFRKWDIELVGARFQPGRAFPEGENATLAKAQVRYRY